MAIPDSVYAYTETINVSRESLIRIEAYVHLLKHWQSRMNLVSPSTLPEVWNRHIIDSLQALPLLPAGLTAFADLGSGGGTPALPLAIASGAVVHLYESNSKKAAFLREALRETGSRGEVHNVRLETIKNTVLPKVEAVTARALAPLPLLLDLAQPFLDGEACGVFHKGQDVAAELTEAQKSWRIQFHTEQSVTDSQAVILIVKEAKRV